MTLQEIDKVSVTILMDNSTDLLLTNSIHANRPQLTTNEKFLLPLPIAEHGFSALVDIVVHSEEKKEKNNMGKKIKYKNNNSIFLFDAGPSEDGVIHNADIFGIDFDRIDGVILSHGHFDHFTGLANILRKISLSRPKSTGIDLLAHPEAFLKRWEVFQDGKRVQMPFLDEGHLKELGALIHKRTGITFLPSDESPSLLVTGEIPRKTSFEKGFPFQYVENQSGNETRLIPDPLVRDDQAIVVNVKDKGLVILTACGHSGIVNTINYAKKVAETDKVHAVLGGFHLPADGGIFEEAIEPTLKELQKIDPDYIVPCHCTGWKAANRIIETMPEKYLQSSVGTTFSF
ncbi:MAG TPA: MBL fold metallo-hydrolase [Nitrososphaeraceae archaeon]|jgi:Metal-dependent hydrolases of the beta-lactamase superfamily II|nr:MBL fold metallo-hydrolase [Nitrososphaeraceae archaeon]